MSETQPGGRARTRALPGGQTPHIPRLTDRNAP